MNIGQRILLMIVGVIILIGGIITAVIPDLTFLHFLGYLFILLIATGLFYFAFSSKKNTNTVKKEAVKKQIDLKQQTSTSQIKGEIQLPPSRDTKTMNQLDDLIQSSDDMLYKITSIFPFDLFPSDIIINRKQVLIVDRYFFWAGRDFPILIKNITMPIVATNLFFASIIIEVSGYDQDTPPLRYFKKAEAFRAKRIIIGLVICDREGVDLTGLTKEQVLQKVEEIGKANL